ncbi:MAG: hypothetical protein L6R35_005244 [Caloplaca aegaea]|nr:MAG: hypothetical protein L6R35_005244 [Caloplaca aegaea]
MPSRRVVQDSDEEDNAGDSPVRPSGIKITSASTRNAQDGALSESPKSKRSIPPSGPSTGSTEVLNGEINDAYTKLLEPSTSRSSRASLPSSGSLPASKRRPTTDLVQDTVKKPKVTYSKRKLQGDSFLGGSSDDEEPVTKRKRVRSSVIDQYSKDGLEEAVECPVTSSRSSSCAGKLNDITQSSTMVRADENESRSDQALAATEASMPPPASRSCGSVMQHSQSSEGSTMLFTGPASSPPLPRDNHKSSEEVQAKSPSNPDDARWNSTTSRAQIRAHTDVKLPEIILGEEVPPSSSAPSQPPAKRQRLGSIGGNDASSRRCKEMDGGHDELSLSAASSPHKTGAVGRRHETTVIKSIQLDDSGLENLMPDLPQEKYQPRPSRSRSALTSDELLIPEDFSKRPEALAKSKGKSKRRRTTEFEGSKQHDVNGLPNIASTTSSGGTKGNPDDGGVLDKKVIPAGDREFESNNRGPARGLSPQPAPAKKARGRPKKENAAPDAILDSSLIQPARTGNSLGESSSPTKPADATITHAKRGRKSKKASAATNDDLFATTETHNSKGGVAVVPEKALVESNANIQVSSPSKIGVTEEPSTLDTSMAMSKVCDKSSTEARDEKPPLDVKVEEGKESVKHSPGIQEGKSIYRIGLSKRQRIPSLLRIVRK